MHTHKFNDGVCLCLVFILSDTELIAKLVTESKASCILCRLLYRWLLEEERNKEMQQAGLWKKQNLYNRSFLALEEEIKLTTLHKQ